MKISQLTQASSFAGLGLLITGIGNCMQGNLQEGVPQIILGALAVLKKEGGAQ